jgi:hypothetical protein
MRVTEWYSANINPVRKGWYEISIDGREEIIDMAYWNGCRWQWYKDSDYQAAIYAKWGDTWRGLARKAK